MKAANRLKAIDDQVAGQNDLGDYHDNGLYYSQHQTAEFAYDANGNLEHDLNRNIGIKYGILHNLPIYLTYRQTGGGGSIATFDLSSAATDKSSQTSSTSYSGTMMNYYTLQGRKLAKKVYNDQHTLTLNESYYDELMLSHRQPARISHADGYVSLDENGEATFYYYLTDHTSASLSAGLGNVRSVITPDADGKPQVEQANDYFPFGMSFESRLPLLSKSGSTRNNFKYNGKEEQEMPGKWLDYHARFYDPALGRWSVVDPMAEQGRRWSPYTYVFDNPMRYIDPDGMWAEEYKFQISGKITTGKVGLEGKIEGVGIGGNYNLGGGEIQVSFYLTYDTESKMPGIGVSYSNSLIEEGSYDATIGPFSGGVESKKEITSLDLNTSDGFTQKSDNKYKKTESGGLFFFSTEETKGEDSKSLFGGNAEINAALVGVGLDLRLEKTETKPDQVKADNEIQPIIQIKEKEL